MIAAMGENRVIGADNQMMWHLPKEYKYFKNTTMDHCIIMGRKNFEAMGKKPLPGRTTIIVTRQDDYDAGVCQVVNSLEAAIEAAREKGETEVFICGGGQIYELGVPHSDRIYLTVVDFSKEGDVYFPEFDESKYEKETLHHEEVGERNAFAWTAYLYTKK